MKTEMMNPMMMVMAMVMMRMVMMRMAMLMMAMMMMIPGIMALSLSGFVDAPMFPDRAWAQGSRCALSGPSVLQPTPVSRWIGGIRLARKKWINLQNLASKF